MTTTLTTQQQDAVMDINAILVQSDNSRSEIWHDNSLLGERLHEVKGLVNGSTKEFGAWLTEHVPQLDVKLVSYYIKLAGYNDDQYDAQTIQAWLRDNYVVATHPRTTWDKFNKAHKDAPADDTQDGEVESTTHKNDSVDSSLSARLEKLLTEIKTKMSKQELDDSEMARIANLSDLFAEVVGEV